MNSLELAYQLRRISIDSSYGSLPPPPHQLDCSGFDKINSASSFNSYGSQSSNTSSSSLSSKTHGKSLYKSRCVSNLSAMGSVSSEATLSRSSVPKCELSAPNAGSWGYFVDSVEQ